MRCGLSPVARWHGLLSLKILSVETHATAVRRRLLTAHERLDPAAFAKL